MRAASWPHSSDTSVAALPAGAAHATLVRLVIAVAAILALLAVWRPTVVHAQNSAVKPATVQPSARPSHVVRTGESLWSIAVRYYGDGAAWTELARANGIVTTATHPLAVGMRLSVPASRPARAAGAPAPILKPGTEVPKVALMVAAPRAVLPRVASPSASGSSLASQTAGKGDAAPSAPRSTRSRSSASRVTRSAAARATAKASQLAVTSAAASRDSGESALGGRTPMHLMVKQEIPIARGLVRIGLLEPGSARAARGNDAPTIFVRRLPTAEESEASLRDAARHSAVAPRRGEYDAAPYAVSVTRLAQGGRIVRRVGAAGGAANDKGQRMLLADEVEIASPAGVTLAVGDRVLALMDDGALPSGLRVGVPGGVLQVTRADAGKPIVAVVKSQSGVLEQGQRLFPLVGEPAPALRADSTTGGGLRTSVLWVEQRALLPTLQSYVLLSAGVPQGVKAGDEFALVRTRGSANTGEEERIAVVRVVRSDATGSTAIVVKQDRAEIATGVLARRVARLP